ncbi:MAG: protein-disulfide reductase DsbD family protein, partial [Opitutaceae bacterium]
SGPPASGSSGSGPAAGLSPTLPAKGALAGTLLFAFLGGLILNLMPCVFPVLGIKILGFVKQAGNDRAGVAKHGLVFALGVLLSFWALAGALIGLRAGGQELGWGFQLQSPVFVFGMAAFLLIFALNLSGVFEFGLSATSFGGGLAVKEGYTGSFFTGLLATLVSTPCAAPFLAPALGVALTLSAAESLLVFTLIAVGLATPYLLLSLFPAAVKVLPRPGAWMETFKQLMAFPLYATVGWLLWVLAAEVSGDGLFKLILGLVVVALGCWVYGRMAAPGASAVRRRVGLVLASAFIALGAWSGWPVSAPAGGGPAPAGGAIAWRRWSPEAVSRLVGQGKIVDVDFTARWCMTCQVNKKLVFSSRRVRETFRHDGIVALEADWTRKDPEITQALAGFGRAAVPFNLIYVPGRPAPIILPEVLSPGAVLGALQKAGVKT